MIACTFPVQIKKYIYIFLNRNTPMCAQGKKSSFMYECKMKSES